ncbi:MAG: hypothetical protein NT040_01125 [Bacteroidetes bacterium]|nr:hypothetical protein [Bacteroidota bacterium]
MPANLNALIRYKTINSCLYGGRRKWSIRELIEACSETLGESRGRYHLISERTVRDDLRVLKSDILGFNAPIEQEKGLYFYSDPHFSILTLKITDAGLADKIFAFLVHLRNDIQHPELESILEQLCKLTDRKYEQPVLSERISIEKIGIRKYGIHSEDLLESFCIEMKTPSFSYPDIPLKEKTALSWGDIFEKIPA